MLSLQLKSGEYLTIGDDIAVQIFQTGPSFRVAVKAPREIPIVRGEVLERENGQRPEGLRSQRPKSPSEKARNAKKLEALALKKEREASALREMQSILERMDAMADAPVRREIAALRSQLEGLAGAQ